MRKIAFPILVIALVLSNNSTAVAAGNLQSTYLSKLTSTLKISWAQKYMGSEGFTFSNKFFLTNQDAINQQTQRAQAICKIFDVALKQKKSNMTAAKNAALALSELEKQYIDGMFEMGKDSQFVYDYEYVQITSIAVGISVYCSKHLAQTKNTLVPTFNGYLDLYIQNSATTSILDEAAADHFVTGSALVTLTQVWRISLNENTGPKSLRKVADEIYDYLTRALGRYPTEQDITVGFQPGNSMHSIFSRLVYDQRTFEAIKQRLIFDAHNSI